MVETLYAMMEVHFKAKMTQVEPPKEDIFKKHKFARRSAQQYDEKTKLLTFKIFDTLNNAGKVKDELWNLLGKEKVFGGVGCSGTVFHDQQWRDCQCYGGRTTTQGFQNAYFGGISR
ncbi:hypothetical protein FOIG_10024 [Fusarium odoratissimum NRRL 54006]|uniref:Uncharacterized protein n=2 Tax=Fusarium oxysporum species complex TaxID=171631 RepID=X0KLH8_FUSO5|nr:uncharacterized protein FOIG_10024 [Fusarium odoratissimum NRRL 54006]EXL97704.1 hypothetical protein FOIG_10024 [Fusarium odoratissimum NRRL 54006]TXB96739.1 hypothetical protein FocTR4_00011237 [Fusarium oxysporum f. sp. cubense]